MKTRVMGGRGLQWLVAAVIAVSFVAAYALVEPPVAEGSHCESSKCVWTSWSNSGYCCSFLGFAWVQQYREQRRICLLRVDPDGTCIYEYCGHCPPVEFRCTAQLCT